MNSRISTSCLVVGLALGACDGRALAWTGQVSWPTFFRAGPGRDYTVLDELDRGTTLEVATCKAGWCLARDGDSTGYAEQEWILRPADMPGKPGANDARACVQSRITGSGYMGGLDYDICQNGAQTGVPSGKPAPGSAAPAVR